jgi:mannose-1-phosphate guanylyltransferase
VDELTGRLTVTLAAALSLIERAAGDALVVVQPADVFYASTRAFVAGIWRAVRALDGLAGYVVTLTVQANRIEPGQDYLLLGADDGLAGRPTARFVKRPQPLIAERLVEAGAHLSTGGYVARLATLMSILADLWPDLLSAARSLTLASDAEVLTPARMSGSHFSRPHLGPATTTAAARDDMVRPATAFRVQMPDSTPPH